jgi:hypothetical protein
MTKAKEALEALEYFTSHPKRGCLDKEKAVKFIFWGQHTIRKALELLDKVEMGGELIGMVPIYVRDTGRCSKEDLMGIVSQVRQCITDKYILIKREDVK